MSRTVKDLYIESVSQSLEGVGDCVVVGLAGLSAEDSHQVRRDLRAKQVQVMVVKNRLASIALDKVGLGDVKGVLDGPCALAWGAGSVVELAKAIQKWADELPAVEVRGGYTDGAVLSAADVKALSDLPSREELLGRVAAQLTATAGRVVALATGPAGRVVSQIKEHVKNLGGGDDGDAQSEAA